MAEFKFKVGDVVTLAVAMVEPRARTLPRLMIAYRMTDECPAAVPQIKYGARIVMVSADFDGYSISHDITQFHEMELAPWPADAAKYQKKRQEAKNPWRKDMREVTEAFDAAKAALDQDTKSNRVD